MRVRLATPGLLVSLLAACGTAPPASQIPDGRSAIARMRASAACGNGVQADAKIDHLGEQGRLRDDLSLLAARPDSLRMDVFAFGVAVATLASDGDRFAIADLREKRFYKGAATPCNLARFTSVPIPTHVLVALLRGQAPILKHAAGTETVAWDRGGYYVLKIAGSNAEEEVHLAPHPDDLGKSWDQARLRVVGVTVRQEGLVLFEATMDEHAPAKMSKPRVDDTGVDPDIPPSGPSCDAEVPRAIHVEVPGLGEDVRFRYKDVAWNPPLVPGVFHLENPGLPSQEVTCP